VEGRRDEREGEMKAGKDPESTESSQLLVFELQQREGTYVEG